MIILSAAGVIYVNETILPAHIKSALLDVLTQATGKTVSISSAKIDIFRGIVIKDLVISDGETKILSCKDVSSRFLIMPVFRKEIVITALKFASPELFVERMKDGSLNVIEIFFKKPMLLKGDYGVNISRIVLYNANVAYRDDTIEPPFLKTFKNVSLKMRLLLPAKAVFDAEFQADSALPAFIKTAGEYNLADKALSVDMKFSDLYIKDYAPYFKDHKLELPEGRMDGEAKINFKYPVIRARLNMTSLSLIFSQDRVKADLNCGARIDIEYDLNLKKLIYTGDLDIKNLSLSNLEYVGRIDDVRGSAIFTDSKFTSDNITCTVSGLPVRAKVSVVDLKTGILDIDCDSTVSLKALKDLLKNKFKIELPAEMSGDGALKTSLQYKLPIKELPVVKGSLSVSDAAFTLEYNKMPLEKVSGRFDFTSNQLLWRDLTFRHSGIFYKSSGILTNFENPGIDIKLNSDKLSLSALVAVNGKFITISRLDGKYEDSEFAVYGDIDTGDPSDLSAELGGTLKFNLKAGGEPLVRFKDILKDAKLSGALTANFNLKGKLKDLTTCAINAQVSSDHVSFYGYKMENFRMDYIQRSGIMDITRLAATLYGGVFDGSGMLDLVSKDHPYTITGEIRGLKIEKAKMDTAFKDYDISGSIRMRFGVKGFSNDISRLQAWGKIDITNGKLWQLNLFKGLGTLVFKKDFSNVIFKEGNCDFSLKDKVAITSDLNLRSDLINLSGVVRVGFDNSINASLKAEFTDEGVDAANMNMAGAIERYSIIEAKGTLKTPNFKIRPDLTSIVSDIAQSVFKK